MDLILDVVQSPLFLGALFFLGTASVLRLLLRNPNLKRSPYGDRRRTTSKMPPTPFYDSEGVLVNENRRTRPDRRRPRLLALQEGMSSDRPTGG